MIIKETLEETIQNNTMQYKRKELLRTILERGETKTNERTNEQILLLCIESAGLLIFPGMMEKLY